MVGGKPWYRLSLVFGEIELDRETCQVTNPFQKKFKSKDVSSHDYELLHIVAVLIPNFL